MSPVPLRLWLAVSALVLAGAAGGRAQERPAAREVTVSKPLVREVTDYEDFTGRTDAQETVDIRARVSGYLNRVTFKDGSEVRKGDLLFEIDPRPYQAELRQVEARLAQAKARAEKATTDLTRARALLGKGGISREEHDQLVSAREEAVVGVKVAEATVELARINLDFCRVLAPINGRISRSYLAAGNLVKADDTLLTTIVSLDPMYVYFDVDERTLLRLRRADLAGRGKPRGALPVSMGLIDEKDFPRRGTVDFVENRVDAKTGTIRVRATFANAEGLLVPGLFVRVRLTTGAPREALLVPEKVVGKDAGQTFVFVVNDKDVVERRHVELGARREGLWEVKAGLRAGERVVTSGLNRLRPGMSVKPRSEDKP